MKKLVLVFLAMFLLASCDWFFPSSPYNQPTPFLPATHTPSIVSPTPVVIGVNSATPMIATSISSPTSTPFAAFTNTPFAPLTDTPIPVSTDTPTITETETAITPSPSISVDVLGCNTSIDVTHGMGEVTNAFVTLKNTGNVDLTNLKATLNALDEGRVHPDKTVELTSLPVGYQVTIKLTVDSTYHQETPIQIEVTADGGLFERVGQDSCRNIGLFAPNPDDLKTPVPTNP
jgi:hypothetical protein